MAISSILTPQNLLTFGAGLAGALSNTAGSRTGTSTSTTTIGPTAGYSSLGDLLRRRAEERLRAGYDLGGLGASGIRSINQAYRGAGQTLSNELTARGLAASPAAAPALTNLQTARGGEISRYLNELPLVARQLQNEDLAAAGNVYANAPRTQTATQTTTAPGSALGSGIGSAAEMLAFLKGQGLFGGESGGVLDQLFGGLWSGDGGPAGIAGGGGSTAANIGSQVLQGAAGTGLSTGLGALLGGATVPAIGALAGGAPAALAASGALPAMTAAMQAGAAESLAALPALAGPAGAAGSGGIGASLAALATNPITLAALGGLGAFVLGKKVFGIGNTHEKADEWVQTEQNRFDAMMDDLNRQEQAGLGPEIAAELRKRMIRDYVTAGREFAARGSDQRRVIDQAFETLRRYYGPQLQQAMVAGYLDVPQSYQQQGWF